jgi:hypothetical protein
MQKAVYQMIEDIFKERMHVFKEMEEAVNKMI